MMTENFSEHVRYLHKITWMYPVNRVFQRLSQPKTFTLTFNTDNQHSNNSLLPDSTAATVEASRTDHTHISHGVTWRKQGQIALVLLVYLPESAVVFLRLCIFPHQSGWWAVWTGPGSSVHQEWCPASWCRGWTSPLAQTDTATRTWSWTRAGGRERSYPAWW